jgi:hypothetical protein
MGFSFADHIQLVTYCQLLPPVCHQQLDLKKIIEQCTEITHMLIPILWPVDLLLGNNHETSNYTTAIAK